MLYYVASGLQHLRFRHYRHHRPLTLLEVVPWIRGAWRKQLYRWIERKYVSRLTGAFSGKFFLVPLQVSIDSQISEHSRFTSIGDFIRHVVASFARHAPEDAALVIKHHPFDRGYHDYSRLIRQLAAEHGLSDRLLYVHDQHLPTLLNHLRGVVVINSTVGFSALTQSAPVKTLGVAVYDLRGMTFQGSLDEFWRGAESFRPDAKLVQHFRAYMIEQTQLNGSFYTGPLDAPCAALLSVARQVGTYDVRPIDDTGEQLGPLTADTATAPTAQPLGLITLSS
jgi:capsular polysaccharide export protein